MGLSLALRLAPVSLSLPFGLGPAPVCRVELQTQAQPPPGPHPGSWLSSGQTRSPVGSLAASNDLFPGVGGAAPNLPAWGRPRFGA